MTFETGDRNIQQAASSTARRRIAPEPVGDTIPASPPAAVLDEVDAAFARTLELAEADRELHFSRNAATGRMVVAVRTLDGEVLRTLRPSQALAVMAGAEL